MAAVVQNTNNTTIRSILPAKKLTGSNFTNWYRNLRIVLRYEKKIKFVEQPIGPAPDPETADPDTIDKYYESVNLKQEVACLMLSSMSPNLQRTLEKYNAYDMMKELKTMFEEQAKQELFKTVKAFHASKQEDGIPKKAETPAVLAIREGKIQKDKKKLQRAKGKAKGKNKLAYAPKTKIPPPPKRDNLAKDSICHHCKEGLRRSRKSKHGALSLYIGNGMHTAVEAIGSFDLILPNDFSRYGFVYLMKHKHELFETFKVFQNEVENQLGYPKETMGYYFYYPLKNKIFVSRNAKFFENSFMVQEASGSHGLIELSGSDKGLEIIQGEDIQPSKNTSKEHNEVAPIEVEP
ncbi:hypothetical protein Tco_0660986 [Tanacetum coccineum]